MTNPCLYRKLFAYTITAHYICSYGWSVVEGAIATALAGLLTFAPHQKAKITP